jgi:diguanylate cyclase (GGDEF)-like protein
MLALAIVNLALGYAAAMALTEPPLWSGWIQGWANRMQPAESDAVTPRVAEAALDRHVEAASSDLSEATVPAPVAAGLDELPADWLAQLAAEGIVAQSFVEAAAHALRLEVGRYREQLVAAEVRTRASGDDRDVESLQRLIDSLRFVNQDWLDKQTAAADMLSQRAGRLGDHEQAAVALEQALLDQAAQIRTACGTLESLDAASEAETRCKLLLEQITALLIQAHALRDGILDLLATLMRDGKALDGFGAAVQRDIATGLPNRIGLEMLLDGWWREDEQRRRLLSAIVIDIDRFGRVNQRLGTRSGDRAIVAVSRLIDETLAKDKGFERLVRIGGEAFMILQGDVGPHQALTAAERLRQSIEATTFDDDGNEFDLTISCGVIEVGHTESSLELVKRGIDALRFAKKAGRNRCALDKGEGPAMIDPPQFPVKGRVVSLRAAMLTMAAAASAPVTSEPRAANPVSPPSA